MRLKVDDIALRVVSVLLALALWFAVASEKSAEAPVTAPVEYRNVADKLEIIGDVPRAVEVWVRGAPGLVQRLRAGEVYVQVDLQGASAGPRTVHLLVRDIHVPYAVTAVAVRPASFSLTLDSSVQRTLPVKARVEGEPAKGFRLAAVRSEPAQLVVAGPQSRLAKLEAVDTQPVSLDQVQMTFTREVGVELADPLLRLVDSPRVRVTAQVEKESKPAGNRRD
jgi:YbbR domain-containing protein